MHCLLYIFVYKVNKKRRGTQLKYTRGIKEQPQLVKGKSINSKNLEK